MDMIEVLRDAVRKNAATDDDAMFALLDATLCDLCCSGHDGGNTTCKPAQ